MGTFMAATKKWFINGGYGWGHFLAATKRVALDGVIF